MKKVIIIMLSLLIVGCTTVHEKYRSAVNKYGKLDHDRDYLHTENYVAERVTVPNGLSDTRFEDKFTVPLSASSSTGNIPSETPPVVSDKS